MDILPPSTVSPDQLLIDDSSARFTNDELSAESVKVDIAILLYALERAYPGKWSMNEESWNAVLDRISSINGPLCAADLAEQIANHLWPIPDGHLKVKGGATIFGQGYRNSLRPSSVGENSIRDDRVWDVQKVERDGKHISLLAIRWFPQPSEASWSGFFEQFPEIVKSEALIIDLRGNDGGNDQNAMELASYLLGRPLPLNWIQEVICESPGSYALQANTYQRILDQCVHREGSAPSELVVQRNYLLQRMRELNADAMEKRIHRDDQFSPSIPLPLRPYPGKIFVLIDSRTKSSGEWAALYLKRHPNTILVGEHSYGMIHFGNGGLLRLPKSGIEVTLCMKLNELVGGRFYEKAGIPPDIPVKGDALSYVLNITGDE